MSTLPREREQLAFDAAPSKTNAFMRIIDKSRVTGAESSRYLPSRSVVATAGLAVAVLVVVACGGGSHAAASNTSKPAVSARPTVTSTSKSPTTRPTAGSTTTGSGSALASKLLPAPPGYVVSTQATNGPMTPAQVDQSVRQKGAAASFGLVAGYGQSYKATLNSDSIVVLLFQCASPVFADSFVAAAPTRSGFFTTDLDHTQGTLPGIPGSLLVDSTKADDDGYYVHQVLAQKGRYVFALEYKTETAGPLAASVANFASHQYKAL